MAATKKSKSGTKAASTASKTTAGAGTSASKNTKAAPVKDGTNPSAPKARTTAPKKAAPVKITDKQRDFLKKIHDAGSTGYEPANKNEQRAIDSMSEKKLLKRGSKNKEKGVYRYLLTRTGETHLTIAAAPSA